jgi:hypothetical protein
MRTERSGRHDDDRHGRGGIVGIVGMINGSPIITSIRMERGQVVL